MNWIDKIVKIKSTLLEAEYKNTVNDIVDAQMILGTPGEMYLEVMNVLLRIKKDNRPEWKLIKDDVNELLQYGKDTGYFII